jgi:hypothetical protein
MVPVCVACEIVGRVSLASTCVLLCVVERF